MKKHISIIVTIALLISSVSLFLPGAKVSASGYDANITVSVNGSLQGVTGIVKTFGTNKCPGYSDLMSFSTGNNGVHDFGSSCDSYAGYCIVNSSISKPGYRLVSTRLSIGESWDDTSQNLNGPCGHTEPIASATALSFAIQMEAIPAAPASPAPSSPTPTTGSSSSSSSSTPASTNATPEAATPTNTDSTKTAADSKASKAKKHVTPTAISAKDSSSKLPATIGTSIVVLAAIGVFFGYRWRKAKRITSPAAEVPTIEPTKPPEQL